MALLRNTEITLREVAQIEEVLLGQRPIESIVRLIRFDHLWIRCCFCPKIGEHWVAGYQVGENERNRCDPKSQKHRGSNALQYKADKRRPLSNRQEVPEEQLSSGPATR